MLNALASSRNSYSLASAANERNVHSYAARARGANPAWKASFRTISAHAIRAFLLARATVATLTGRRVKRFPSQADVAQCLCQRTTVRAPCTSNRRR
jgi:hypothetical protein